MTTPPPAPMANPRLAISAVFVQCGALLGAWAARVPAVADRFSLEPRLLGLLLLCLAAGAIVSFPLAGRLADRHGPAQVARAISVAYMLSLPLLALAPGVPALALLLLFFGACHGALDVAMNTWAAEAEKAAGRPQMSSYHAMFSLGAGLGALTGALAAASGLGLLAHFCLVAVLMSLPALWLSRGHASTVTAGAAAGRPPILAMPRGILLLVGICVGCATLAEGAMVDWSALYLTHVAGVGEGAAALGYSVFAVAMVAMRLMGDRVTAAWGAAATARAAGVSAATGSMLAVATGGYLGGLVGFALMGLGLALIFPLGMSRAAAAHPASPGTAIAGVATLGYGGLLIGPVAIGFLAHLVSLRLAFLLLTALAVIVALLARVMEPRSAPVALAPASG